MHYAIFLPLCKRQILGIVLLSCLLISNGLSNPIETPLAPTELKAKVLSPATSVRLTWQDNSSNETAFLVYRSQTTANNFVLIHTTTANETTFVDQALSANTLYYYKVRAEATAQNPSEFTLIAPIATIDNYVNIPQALAAQAAPQNQVVLNWANQAAEASGYEIHRSEDGVNFSLVTVLNNAQSTTYTDANLSAVKLYYYKVRTLNGSFASELSIATQVVTLPNPPLAPFRVEAKVVSPTSITIQWEFVDANSAAAQLILESSFDFNQGFVVVDTLPAGQTTYSHTGLRHNTTYYYRMRAFDANGVSAYSNLSNTTTSDLLPPINLAIELAIDPKSMTVSWTKQAPEVKGVTVERANILIEGGKFVTVYESDDTERTSLKDSLLWVANQTYEYRVKVFDDQRSSPYSEVISIATPKKDTIPLPSVPSNLRVEAVSEDELLVLWQDNSSDEHFFIIERSENSTVGFEPIAKVPQNNTRFQDIGLATNKVYYYRVSASNAGGESDYSNIGEARVVCNLLPVVSADNQSVCEGGAALLSVSSNSSRASYQWQLDGVDIPNATLAFYYATSAGIYTCTISHGQCTKLANSVAILVKRVASATIVLSGGKLWVTPDTGEEYFWYRNGEQLEGIVNEAAYGPRETGLYHVVVKLKNGCYAITNRKYVVVPPSTVGLQQVLSTALIVYPNPTTNWLKFELKHAKGGRYQIHLLDALGNTHWQHQGLKTGHTLHQQLNIAHLPQGVYFLQVRLGNLMGTKMIFKR